MYGELMEICLIHFPQTINELLALTKGTNVSAMHGRRHRGGGGTGGPVPRKLFSV